MSFSHMKEINILLRNSTSDVNLAKLLIIVIEVEGPEFISLFSQYILDLIF